MMNGWNGTNEWLPRRNRRSIKPKIEKQVEEPAKQPVISQPVNKEAKKQLQKQQKLVEQLEEISNVFNRKATGWNCSCRLRKFMPTGKNSWLPNQNTRKAALSLTVAMQTYDVALEKLMELKKK